MRCPVEDQSVHYLFRDWLRNIGIADNTELRDGDYASGKPDEDGLYIHGLGAIRSGNNAGK
jgi:hypothetical protein